MGRLFSTLMSRTPDRLICSVLGIGVADSVKNVYIFLELFYFLFRTHPEPLFFIDDQQSEIVEFYILRQQTVRTDQDIHLAASDILENLFLLEGRLEAGQYRDIYGKILKRSSAEL